MAADRQTGRRWMHHRRRFGPPPLDERPAKALRARLTRLGRIRGFDPISYEAVGAAPLPITDQDLAHRLWEDAPALGSRAQVATALDQILARPVAVAAPPALQAALASAMNVDIDYLNDPIAAAAFDRRLITAALDRLGVRGDVRVCRTGGGRPVDDEDLLLTVLEAVDDATTVGAG